MKEFIKNVVEWIITHLSIKKNKVVFLSHLGKSYSCNPKYLCEYLAKQYKWKFDLVWVYTENAGIPKDLPKGVRAVKHYSYQYLCEISTAHYVVSNTRISDWVYFNKRKGQIYIQTWHSSLRLKKIEGDADLGQDYETFARKDSAKTDYIISGCEFSTRIFEHSFWYDGIILKTGTPRIDYLKNITKTEMNAIYSKAHLATNIHYVLYAPTFRKGNDLSAYNLDYNSLIQSLTMKFGGVWKVLFRLHPNLQDLVTVDDLGDFCQDMTRYSDMQELLCISDILITDYSSSMFDMAFLGKPCILYVNDLENYLCNERGLYFDIKSLPFIVVQTNDELHQAIMDYNKEIYDRGISSFMKQIGSYEYGDACEKITQAVFNVK